MPLFEYRCSACGHRFEELVTGKRAVACPSCQGRKVEKLLSTFAVSSGGSSSSAGSEDWGGSGACGTCGDPNGPGSCGD